MEKFGIFDVIEKLSPLKKTAETLLPAIEKLQQTKKQSDKKTEQNLKNKPYNASILAYIKRHDEISKRIDSKNKP